MTKARELSKLLSGTLKVGALQAPAGTTAQRPSGQVGQIRYNATLGKNEVYDADGWAAIASPPLITSVSPSTYNGESGTQFTISGSFFDSSVTVKFITNNGTEYSAATVSRINASQLIATTPQDFTVAQEPLKVKVVNGSGLSYVLDAAIDCGGVPVWNTAAGTLATVADAYGSYSNVATLSAGDPDAGATVTFALASGALPTGMSLSSSGVISGDPSDVSSQTTSNFTVNAVDNAGNTTARAFNIIVNPAADGSSAARAAISASAIKTLTGTNSNGVYWIKPPTGGSGAAFQVYCVMDRYGGGWMKFLQWFGGTDMNNANAINAGGAWCSADINGAAGKLANSDIHALQANGVNNSFLMRVGGGGDNLFNNGSGTGKFQLASGSLSNWGTDIDPTSTYTLSLDTSSNDSWDYVVQYTNDPQGRCGHTAGGSKLWYSDHNYNWTILAGSPPNSSYPQCFSIGQYGLITNLHWMSGQPTQSAGEIQWGTSAGAYAALYIK